MMTRRRFLQVAVGGPCLAGMYAWRIEPTWVEYVRLKLPVKNLPETLEGKTLVQLSDLHIGAQVDPDYLTRTFATVAAMQPDIVVYTGDFVTYAGPATLEQLRNLAGRFPRGKLGTAAILGNHDYGDGWRNSKVADDVARIVTDQGCRVLRNQGIQMNGLTLVGLDDLWSGHLRFPPLGAAARLPSLVLCHNPDACDLPGWEGYDGWILAGHTHGGQCKPPFLPPLLLPVRNRRYTAGKFALSGNRTLYINRGLGHLLRVRFNVRPEVTIFTLARA